ncbi:MAG: DNA repair protein RecN [Bacteroidota bacterium]
MREQKAMLPESMIERLLIKNYAIIESLEINFSSGLTIITGETGAGKSILLGALGLIMGNRADTKSLYQQDLKCIIEGHFDVSKYDLQDFFEENDIDYDAETVVRRELTPSGKSRAFVNDTPVNLKVLQQLSAALIDLHQQFDTRDIHNVSFQLRMIDALAGNRDDLSQYQKRYRQYQADKRRLAQLIEQSNQASREADFLQFQLKELAEAELQDDEQEQIEEEQSLLTNAEDIKRTLGAAYRALNEEEQSIVSQMEAIAQALNSIKAHHPEVSQLYDRYQGLLLEIQDVAGDCEKIAEDTEYDAERILEIQSRLDLIYKLQSKHQLQTVGELLELQASLEDQLKAFGDLSGEISRLEQGLEKHEKQLHKMGARLSKARKSVVGKFEKRVHELLAQLSMEHARLKVDIHPLEQPGPTGTDEVEFLFAPNKGSRFQSIKEVASGGELSRLTLCTKSLVASAIPLPTLIFDEIDTGISGDVAMKMGNILQHLSDKHQVVSITHSPQIAVKADTHYFVYKKVKDDRTVTRVRPLQSEERIRAVATMLSGNPPTESAIENARELLQQKA